MTGARLIVLAAILAGLASVVAMELLPRRIDPIVVPDNPLAVASPRPAAAAAIGTDRSQAEAQAILARPLFSPTRRPPAAGAAAPGAPPPSLPRVAGILMNGDHRSVIFAATGDVRPVVLDEGGEVNGFKVQSIEDGQVTVLGPDGPRVLHPTFDPNPPAPTARAPAPPLGAGLAGIPGLPGLPGLPVLAVPGGPAAAVAR